MTVLVSANVTRLFNGKPTYVPNDNNCSDVEYHAHEDNYCHKTKFIFQNHKKCDAFPNSDV